MYNKINLVIFLAILNNKMGIKILFLTMKTYVKTASEHKSKMPGKFSHLLCVLVFLTEFSLLRNFER